MNYLEQIVSQFPIRRKAEQKKAFRDWAVQEISTMGYSVKVEENGHHHNVIVGNPEQAPVLFTAHYDTPNANYLPNLMMPRNPVLYMLYVIMNVMILMLASAVVMLAVGAVTGDPQAARLALIGTYFALLMVMNFANIPNKNNVNDNTSGIATLLTIMAQLPKEDQAKAAFILFDNEEKGLAGSKAYTKEHQQVAYTRMTINLDCVGVGGNILVISQKLARQHLEFAPMQRHMEAITTHQVHFFDSKGSVSNSDWKNFKCGIAVMACKKAPVVGFYTPNIHTRHDTLADIGNINAIATAMSAYIQELNIA